MPNLHSFNQSQLETANLQWGQVQTNPQNTGVNGVNIGKTS